MIKYNRNIQPYTHSDTVGPVNSEVASMICCPTFNTSTTLINITSDVVLIILVARLIALGTSRRTACGTTTYRETCASVSPSARPLSL